MKKNNNTIRLGAIAGLYLLIAIFFIGRLLYLQVSGQDYYSTSAQPKEYTRQVKIQAQRGEIFDRNGKKLVSNEYSYDVSLDYSSRPSTQAEMNDLILTIRGAAVRKGSTDSLVEPRASVTVTVNGDGGLDFSVTEGFFETSRGKKINKLAADLGVKEDDLYEKMKAIMKYFGIMASEKTVAGNIEDYYQYPPETAATLLITRLDMYLRNFSAIEPYLMIEDASVALLTDIEESIQRGTVVTVNAAREYHYPGYASHILGRIGAIQSGMVEYFTERGYSMDAVVGLDGVEFAAEEYLHGTDGVLTITEDEYGNVLRTEITKDPIAGRDVYLTIDIEMQMIAERALAENIFKIRDEAIASGKPHTGEDASSGAMTVLDVNTGEALAICSYPTYNLATFYEDYATLSADKTYPMFNRALNGTFAPGSTFKVGVAVAALTEGTIEADTIIDAQGEYLYYESSNFTPRCWLYLMTGSAVHGEITVVEAIQESCNYFFYDVGRLLTIEKMNEYSHHFGLGEPTGIELSESYGILAGPDYRNKEGLDKWSPGDTLQAAIGQSDNLFTPLQISSYIATILNSGSRYQVHMIGEVREYGTNKLILKNFPRVIDGVSISDEILATVKEGMKGVMDNGSAASVFAGYEIPVGGKTGTAQVSDTKSDNGIITAFAPFDDPEIVVTCIIEQGKGGTEAGYSVRDVFDYYFKLGKYKVEEPIPETPEDSENMENTEKPTE